MSKHGAELKTSCVDDNHFSCYDVMCVKFHSMWLFTNSRKFEMMCETIMMPETC